MRHRHEREQEARRRRNEPQCASAAEAMPWLARADAEARAARLAAKEEIRRKAEVERLQRHGAAGAGPPGGEVEAGVVTRTSVEVVVDTAAKTSGEEDEPERLRRRMTEYTDRRVVRRRLTTKGPPLLVP